MKEIWKDIPEYEGIYQVSNLGNVKSLTRIVKHNLGGDKILKERILKLSKTGVGYFNVILCKKGNLKGFAVHKLVAMAFLNHKPCGYNLVVNHKDFNRLNNNVKNLEIITTRENTNQKHLKSESKYTGVHKDGKKWRSVIWINGKNKHLGRFNNEFDAHLAYENELLKLKINQ
jgi:hypothetical protein